MVKGGRKVRGRGEGRWKEEMGKGDGIYKRGERGGIVSISSLSYRIEKMVEEKRKGEGTEKQKEEREESKGKRGQEKGEGGIGPTPSYPVVVKGERIEKGQRMRRGK